eukprot:CAMPEP_0184671416 /NCGR_PEP_ID=MMETSP0308-20130426/85486_1 /TAXON_ID=38269 /ORGANISM="Gloeochaete witrockiana, Strain SAG 46.84" /LENGTH=391 /DNA_ID=CAMNT_0027118541 /DNA_START=43 /DNA_END=1218 /DNA_ORIENTATION=+
MAKKHEEDPPKMNYLVALTKSLKQSPTNEEAENFQGLRAVWNENFSHVFIFCQEGCGDLRQKKELSENDAMDVLDSCAKNSGSCYVLISLPDHPISVLYIDSVDAHFCRHAQRIRGLKDEIRGLKDEVQDLQEDLKKTRATQERTILDNIINDTFTAVIGRVLLPIIGRRFRISLPDHPISVLYIDSVDAHFCRHARRIRGLEDKVQDLQEDLKKSRATQERTILDNIINDTFTAVIGRVLLPIIGRRFREEKFATLRNLGAKPSSVASFKAFQNWQSEGADDPRVFSAKYLAVANALKEAAKECDFPFQEEEMGVLLNKRTSRNKDTHLLSALLKLIPRDKEASEALEFLEKIHKDNLEGVFELYCNRFASTTEEVNALSKLQLAYQSSM